MVRHGSFLLAGTLVLSGCIPAPDGSRAGRRPEVKPQTEETRACVADLNRMRARYTLLPDQSYGGGCSTNGSVQLIDVGYPVTNIRAIKCPLARTLTLWARGPVQDAARDAFGERVVRLETMGAYSCRNKIGGRGGGLSEHASAGAVDISGFVLADGRRVTLEAGWQGSGAERAFLRDVRDAACRQFRTVLSPDYNAAHYNHLHFDNGSRGMYCR
jgi:hypothetical protein